MGKYSNHKKMDKGMQGEAFVRFAKAMASIRNPVEAAQFIKDLLSEQEAVMLGRRLQVAEMLNEGNTYENIRKSLKVSPPTIARVQQWLEVSGEGFRTVLGRTKPKAEKSAPEPLSWDRLKHKYPMYFWPQLLMENIVKSASKREKSKLLNVMTEMKEKTKMNRQLSKQISLLIKYAQS